MLIVAILGLGLILIGVPIAFALGVGGMAGIWLTGLPLQVSITRFFAGVDSFVFLAVPFYILAAEIMNRSGITTRLIRLASFFTGRFHGGTAYANVGSSVLFAGISGSAVADTSALGKFFINEMPREGYSKEYTGAVTVASAIIGPIIPPSGLAIIMAAVTGISVIDLFVAGVVPGLLIGGACLAIIFLHGRHGGLPKPKVEIAKKEIPLLVVEALLVALLPIVIVGGMIVGAFTATEGGGIAVAIASILGVFVFKELNLAGFWAAVSSAARMSASIYLLVACAAILSYALNLLGISNLVSSMAPMFESQPWLFLLSVMLLMLVLGMFLDIGAAIVIFAPLLMPLGDTLGIDPIQTSIIIILTLAVGLITPPVGVVLFIMMRIGEMKMLPLLKQLFPFLIAELLAILLLVFFPALSTWLPEFFR
ncbi:TRAP transporter large permease [Modicisalibacter radicis]|uniref:TRAP transporter large permease n=1 Tax=Halomonas sp. EAR18 TaxID=2518972 RepID=UPI00109C4C37|nr:TRAP transporter large permease [Halomonas sp. EAR18]